MIIIVALSSNCLEHDGCEVVSESKERTKKQNCDIFSETRIRRVEKI